VAAGRYGGCTEKAVAHARRLLWKSQPLFDPRCWILHVEKQLSGPLAVALATNTVAGYDALFALLKQNAVPMKGDLYKCWAV
jgi:hypothetical protein